MIEDLGRIIDEDIKAREKFAADVAKHFQNLRGISYTDFLIACLDNGIDLDFITSVTLHEEINKGGE